MSAFSLFLITSFKWSDPVWIYTWLCWPVAGLLTVTALSPRMHIRDRWKRLKKHTTIWNGVENSNMVLQCKQVGLSNLSLSVAKMPSISSTLLPPPQQTSNLRSQLDSQVADCTLVRDQWGFKQCPDSVQRLKMTSLASQMPVCTQLNDNRI